MKLPVHKILEMNGIKIDGYPFDEKLKGQVYQSQTGEIIHIYPDRIVYYEDIRCGHLPQTVMLK